MLRRLAALLLLLTAGIAEAQTFPKFTGYVVDAANVLSPSTEDALSKELARLQQDTGRQVVVATIADVQGYDLATYGNGLIRNWGVGLKGVDNGAILFVAPNEPAGRRGPRLEVGYGLEPVLTDAFSSVMIRQEMLPRLRNGNDVDGAMTAGVAAIDRQLRASPDEAKARTDAAIKEFDRTHRRSGNGGGGIPIALVFWGIVLASVVIPMFANRGWRRGRRYRSDGGTGGGGGGVLPVVLWSIANEIGRSGGGWGGGGSGDSGSSGGWGGGGFSGGGAGSGGGGGASGDW